jgi:hypothetical protein
MRQRLHHGMLRKDQTSAESCCQRSEWCPGMAATWSTLHNAGFGYVHSRVRCGYDIRCVYRACVRSLSDIRMMSELTLLHSMI